MKEEKFKSTKLLEEAIREHRADYPRGVGKYKDGVYYGLTLALQLLTSDSQVPAAKVEPYVEATWTPFSHIGRDEYGRIVETEMFKCSNCGNMVVLGNDERCHHCFAHMKKLGEENK